MERYSENLQVNSSFINWVYDSQGNSKQHLQIWQVISIQEACYDVGDLMSDGGTHAENNENWERYFIVKQLLNQKIWQNKFFVFCHSLIYIFLKDFVPSDF